MKPFLSLSLLVIALTGFSFRPRPAYNKGDITLQDLTWLLGTWENKTERGSIYESWEKSGNYKFNGKSYALKGTDSVIFEQVALMQVDGVLFYIPTVKKQNGGQPVTFALKSSTEETIVFENAAHDFPQLITYTQITNDSLVAEISGTKNGKQKTVQFSMKRVSHP